MEETAAVVLKRDATAFASRWCERALFALAAAVVAFLLGALTSQLLDGGSSVVDAYNGLPQGVFLALFISFAIIWGPLLETALMAAILAVLKKRLSAIVAIFLSASIWALIHRVGQPAGWCVFFPFVVFSGVYLLRKNGPKRDGFVVASMTHALHNAIAIGVAFLVPEITLRFQ